MKQLLALLLAIHATGALAQTAYPCDWEAHADAIVEPWEDNSATFANGAVRIALLDVAEPAAAAFFLLILHPPHDELGLRHCTVVGLGEGFGYAAIHFSELEAGYDPAQGLTFDVPATIYLPENSFQNPALLHVTVNQASGDVTVTQDLGNE